MKEAPREVQEMFAGLLQSFEHDRRKAEERAAQKDPLAYKMTTVMKDTSYRYYAGGTNGKGQRVLFCYSTHRNVAGFFLGWRETYAKNGRVKRDMMFSRRKRKRVAEMARQRSERFKARRQAKKEVGFGSTPHEARADREAEQQ